MPAAQPEVAYLPDPNARLGGWSHLVDEACIGRCLSYGNYEASSGYFRLRSDPGNPLILGRVSDVIALQEGRYVVHDHDVPLYLVYRCGPMATDLCLRQLHPGEVVR
jgi:hypothetical protein